MRTRIKFTQIAMGLALLAAPMMLLAQDDDQQEMRPEFDRGRPGDRREQSMDRIPDLTDDQKQKMEAIHLELKKEILPVENQINEKEARLRTLQTAEKVDMKAIYATIDDISALRTQVAKKRAEAHQSVRALLTEDQRVVFDSGVHSPEGVGHHPGRDHRGMGRK